MKDAQENGLAFQAIDDLTTTDGIKVIVDKEFSDSGVSLQTKLLSEADEEYYKIDITDKIADGSISPDTVTFRAYDISLVDES